MKPFICGEKSSTVSGTRRQRMQSALVTSPHVDTAVAAASRAGKHRSPACCRHFAGFYCFYQN